MAVMKQGGGSSKAVARAFTPQRVKRKATTEPAARVADLKGFWRREYAVYRACIVKVTAKQDRILSFRFVNTDASIQEEEYTVDLDDGGSVRGELPSTAHLVEDPEGEATIGYLFLTEDWIAANVEAAVPVTTRRLKASPGAPAASPQPKTPPPAPPVKMAKGPKDPLSGSL
jgi:hypothetical protein